MIDKLWISVGRGALSLTDIYFSFSQEQRIELKATVELGLIHQSTDALERVGLTLEEVELFKMLRSQQVVGSPMYELVSKTELAIHEFIRNVLIAHFGNKEYQWWRKGIPLEIRKKCQSRREEDEEPSDSTFNYTDLIDLSVIIVGNWDLFGPRLRADYRANRRHLKSDFVRLNDLRKAVMHPVKRKRWTEEDYKFIRQFREYLWADSSADGLLSSECAPLMNG